MYKKKGYEKKLRNTFKFNDINCNMPGVVWNFNSYTPKSELYEGMDLGELDDNEMLMLFNNYQTANWDKQSNLYGFQSIKVKKVDLNKQ